MPWEASPAYSTGDLRFPPHDTLASPPPPPGGFAYIWEDLLLHRHE